MTRDPNSLSEWDSGDPLANAPVAVMFGNDDWLRMLFRVRMYDRGNRARIESTETLEWLRALGYASEPKTEDWMWVCDANVDGDGILSVHSVNHGPGVEPSFFTMILGFAQAHLVMQQNRRKK